MIKMVTTNWVLIKKMLGHLSDCSDWVSGHFGQIKFEDTLPPFSQMEKKICSVLVDDAPNIDKRANCMEYQMKHACPLPNAHHGWFAIFLKNKIKIASKESQVPRILTDSSSGSPPPILKVSLHNEVLIVSIIFMCQSFSRLVLIMRCWLYQ